MNENPLKELINQICGFISAASHDSKKPAFRLIRKNTEKLEQNGDLLIPNDASIWRSYVHDLLPDAASELFGFECADSADVTQSGTGQGIYNVDDLVAASKHWKLRVSRAEVHVAARRCCIYLDRIHAYRKCMARVLQEYSGAVADPIVVGCDDTSDTLSVTEFRMKVLARVIENLAKISPTSGGESVKKSVHVTTRSSFAVAENVTKIISGSVTDPRRGNKLAAESYEEYMRKRSSDMQLMAQHKYGLRVRNEKIFIDLIKRLGEAAVTFDFLEVKHSSPVSLNVSGCSTSKGAAFVLYNSARIETILRKFDEKVESGYYKPLPTFDEVDFELLKEEEEWQLMYVYVIGFPELVEKSIGDIHNGRIAPHLICSYLCGLVGLFSVYYRRCRVLMENRPQLVPTLYARIYLLMCIRRVMNDALKLLDIEPVPQMYALCRILALQKLLHALCEKQIAGKDEIYGFLEETRRRVLGRSTFL